MNLDCLMGCAWLWMYAGLLLMLMELLLPGFIIIFFGFAALSVGTLKFTVGDGFTLSWQLAAFSTFSILYLVFLRRLLKGIFTGRREIAKTDFGNESVGRVGTLTEAVVPPVEGRVLIGDAEWTAVADAEIPLGASVRVVAQNNLTMKVEEISR